MVIAPASLVVWDDVLPDPGGYRAQCLAQPFGSIALGPQTFHGIALPPSLEVRDAVATRYPWFDPRLTFLRCSPLGQIEPNDLHDDGLMGTWTGILYLNPDPPQGDGTIIAGEHVAARFNRLTVFAASLPHRRAIFDNYGDRPATARLIQVLFGGAPVWQ